MECEGEIERERERGREREGEREGEKERESNGVSECTERSDGRGGKRGIYIQTKSRELLKWLPIHPLFIHATAVVSWLHPHAPIYTID